MCNSKTNETNPTKSIKIETESIKLDSFLKFVGAASTGGEAKEIINSGKVLVNEKPCFARGKKLVDGDKISVDGKSFYEVKSSENSRA